MALGTSSVLPQDASVPTGREEHLRAAGQLHRAADGPRQRSRRIGTAARLAAFQALMLAGILALVVAGLVHAFDVQSRAGLTRQLVAESRAFEQQARSRPPQESIDAFTRRFLAGRALPEGETIVVVLPGSTTLGSPDPGPLFASGLLRPWTAAPGHVTVSRSVRVAGRPARLLAVPLQDGGAVIGTFVVIADETRPAADRERVLRLALGEALVALLAGSAAGYLLLRRLLGTVGRITSTAAGLGRGEMDGRLGDQGRADEVGELASTFDDMADRVASAMEAQRRLLADVSHQLRTPLTVARGNLEVLQRTGREDPVEVDQTVSLVVDELDHMRRLVERLLLLGAAMDPDFLEPVPIELGILLADVQESSRVLGDRRWVAEDVPDLVIVGDPGKLRGALLNLTDNAARATADGGIVEIGATRLPDGGVEIHVADDGPGIPAPQRLAATARFRRPGGGADRGDGGLGLAIVKAVAEAHGGTLQIGESRYGGCLVRIALPAGIVRQGAG